MNTKTNQSPLNAPLLRNGDKCPPLLIQPQIVPLQALQGARQESIIKRIDSFIKSLTTRRTFALANESQEDLSMIGAESVELANDIAQPDGWACIAKYGEHPHPGVPGTNKKLIQRFDRNSAEDVVKNFQSVWGRIKRAVVGVPLYLGHPDVAAYANVFPDKTTYGTWAALEAREDGLYGRPVLTLAGSRHVEDGKDRLSPYWDCKPVGFSSDGTTMVSPTHLRSVGLVVRGNIPGPSLMNCDCEPQAARLRRSLIAMLTVLEYKVGDASSDEEIICAANEAVVHCAALLSRLGELSQANKDLKTEKQALASSASEAIATANAERLARATLLANDAFLCGRISGTDRDAWITTLANASDFSAQACKLALLKPTLRTQSQVSGLGSLGNKGASRSEQILALVNARMSDEGEDYETAFAHLQTTSPALFQSQP